MVGTSPFIMVNIVVIAAILASFTAMAERPASELALAPPKCAVVYDEHWVNKCVDVTENHCRTVTDNVCQDTVDRVCRPVTQDKCSTRQVAQCSTVNEKKCTVKSVPKCSTTTARKCATSKVAKCTTVRDNKCTTDRVCSVVNERQCRTVAQPRCSTIVERVCRICGNGGRQQQVGQQQVAQLRQGGGQQPGFARGSAPSLEENEYEDEDENTADEDELYFDAEDLAAASNEDDYVRRRKREAEPTFFHKKINPGIGFLTPLCREVSVPAVLRRRQEPGFAPGRAPSFEKKVKNVKVADREEKRALNRAKLDAEILTDYKIEQDTRRKKREAFFKNKYHGLPVAAPVCRDIPRQSCTAVQQNVCADVPRQSCHNVKKCAAVPRRYCEDVPQTKCFNAPQTKCVNVPKTECVNVPRRNCVNVPQTKCVKVPRQSCRNVTRKSCSAVPRQVCTPSTRQVCKKELVKKPRQVCGQIVH